MGDKKYGYNHGDFGWVELSAPDPKAATDFYIQVFGWKTETMAMPDGDYTVLISGEEKVGGIAAKNPECDAPPQWLPYVTVTDLAATKAKVEAAGGEVLLERSIPDMLDFFVFKDPQGAKLAAIVYANPEA